MVIERAASISGDCPVDYGLPKREQPGEKFTYRFRREVAFALDPLIEKTPLNDTDFRINRKTLDSLSYLLGKDVVEPLEHAIVEYRWKNLWATAAKLGGGAEVIAGLATGASPALLAAEVGTGTAGFLLSNEFADRAYDEVRQKAFGVAKEFMLKFLPDFYRWTDEEKRTFATEVSEAIAQGESLGRPLFSSAIYALLTIPILAASGYGELATLLGGVQTGVVGLNEYLQRHGRVIKKQIAEAAALESDMRETDDKFGSGLTSQLIFQDGESDLTRLWNRHSMKLLAMQWLSQAGIPIATLFQNIEGLAIALLSQLSSQVMTSRTHRQDYSAAMAGVDWLKQAIKTAERNDNTSLLADIKLEEYCENFKSSQNLERDLDIKRILEETEPDLIARISEFDVIYNDKRPRPTVKLKETLKVYPGLYFMSAPGKGTSPFLNGLCRRHRVANEKTETFFRVGDEWKGLHDLSSQEIKALHLYLSPEPEYSGLSPDVIFAESVKDLVLLATSDPIATGILQRFHTGGYLTPAERRAITLGLKLLAGKTTEDEIRSGPLTKEEKIIFERLVSAFRPEYSRRIFIEQLLRHKVFFMEREMPIITDNDHPVYRLKKHKKGMAEGLERSDVAAISDASSHSVIQRSTRAKLRLLKALGIAKLQGTKIIAIDQTMDPLDDTETEMMLLYMANWCKENKAAIFIATNQENNKQLIEFKSGAFQEELIVDGRKIQRRKANKK